MTAADEFFPESPRVIYGHSPLAEVICQVRFPTVLRIESEVPADFQDRVRKTFPYFERQPVPGFNQMPPEVARLIGAQVQTQYVFRSEDGSYNISLAPDALSVTTTAYKRWEAFRSS